MWILIAGLVVFLGIHLSRAVADDTRRTMILRWGEGGWKGLYSIISLVGLILIAWGYGMARQEPVVLWTPPVWTQHIALTLNLIAFILIGIYAVPTGRLKARLGHPMILGVKVWAFAHLLANGTLADVVLFGSFLAWAIVDFAASRRRDRRDGIVRVAGPSRNDGIAVALGFVLWLALLLKVHEWLIGVSPLA